MSKEQHQFSYAKDQWDEIKKHLRPERISAPDPLRGITSSDHLWWQGEISEYVHDFERDQKIPMAKGKTDERDFVEKKIGYLNELIESINRIEADRFLMQPDFDRARKTAEAMKRNLTEYRRRYLQARPGRPKTGESPLAVKDASGDRLVFRLVQLFDSVNSSRNFLDPRTDLPRGSQVGTVNSSNPPCNFLAPCHFLRNSGDFLESSPRLWHPPQKRKSKFLRACLEPLRRDYLTLPSLTAENLRKKANRLKGARDKHVQKG